MAGRSELPRIAPITIESGSGSGSRSVDALAPLCVPDPV